MTLFELLENHRSFKGMQILDKNLGDGFLFENNPTYKLIRLKTLALGYKFTAEDNNSLVVLPFVQLENIFSTKKILMIDNVSVFERIPLKAQKTINWKEIELGYKGNYLFHESCHVVARDRLKKHSVPSMVLRLLEESFANTCELWSMALAQTSVHRLFYGVNSYTRNYEDGPRIREIVKNLGFDQTFKFTVLSYLHSNFSFSQFTPTEFRMAVELIFKSKLSKKEEAQLQFMAQMAFSLDESFKTATRSLYFKLHNHSEADFQKLRKEYLKGEISNLLDSLAKIFYT